MSEKEKAAWFATPLTSFEHHVSIQMHVEWSQEFICVQPAQFKHLRKQIDWFESDCNFLIDF